MPSLLSEIVERLKMQPGQIIRETVNGHTAELRLLDDDEPTPEFADQMMINVPSAPRLQKGTLVTTVSGPVPLPDPPIIPDDLIDE